MDVMVMDASIAMKWIKPSPIFKIAFPGASIEEDAVMFTSFVNEQHGTYFDYYSLMTFMENCDSIAVGGIITEGFTPVGINFINFLNYDD